MNTRASVISITMRGIQALAGIEESGSGDDEFEAYFHDPNNVQDINCFFVMGPKTVQKK